ncbi:MAG: thioredoxin family protein [Clostridia bacterium]|nr:thioredoxin family protein [Clostridia bacterium]
MDIQLPQGVCLAEVGGGCAGCYGAMPQARAAAQNLDIPFIYIDAEQNTEIIERWQIEKLPTLLIIKNGKPVASVVGYQPQEILELWIKSKLQESGL